MRVLHIVLFILLLVSCSQEQKTKTTLNVSLAALGSEFAGGLFIRLHDPLTGTALDYEIKTYPYVLDLPFGNWDIYVAGFTSAIRTATNIACGSSLNMVLSTSQKQIQITTNHSNCSSNANYTVLASKAGIALGYVWDTATWDGATKWGP